MNKCLFSLGAVLVVTPALFGESLQTAKVTKVINDVKIFSPAVPAKKAQPGDTVSGKTSLQTGRRSRSELRFQDDTLTRVGANSIFSFERGTRDLKLEQGTLLLAVPKNAGGARIRTATVTAAVTGTSCLMEYFINKWVKVIVLEGSLDLWLERAGLRQKKTIKAGQMMVLRANDKRMPNVFTVDLALIMQTAGLLDQESFGGLPKFAKDRIDSAIDRQVVLKKDGFLVPVNHSAGGSRGGGPAGGGSQSGERASNQRDEIPQEPVVGPGEGDDPGGPPSPPRPPSEGDDP